MRFLLTLSLLTWLGSAHAESVRALIQSSPLAGSQYYALSAVWQEIKAGDTLTLVREADNRHDRNAIRVEWRGRKLGYLPRAENRAIAAAMDAGERLSARVSSINDNKNPWQRVAFEVFVEL
ncbi:HIRAN domain-containing protein [Dechloromonas sp. XY25]|uniref:HIRAN domain-containing protein n=1 Tax=Dechloromonas hankyongensis TaxID=2908002 RepID=A0ABS9JZJ4_9RHOO|nr:HIRAN domain-containing protein [Dechloromonas hankyongensis]MCG2576334.1 HIRAN domain-containing protein [Dechloromonas hankyongensis]